MSSASSMNIASKTITSVYIPRVFSNIHPNVISNTFEGQNIGIVDHIQVVQRPKKKGKSSTYMAFVYFKKWHTNQSALNLADRICDPEKQARVVYDDPYYWIVLPNTTKGKGKSSYKSPQHQDQQVSTTPVSNSIPASVSNDTNTIETEKMETLYLMIQDLQERIKHIEDYICILHKYNSLTQLPSSPVTHPDDVYDYDYNVDSDAGDDYTYSYSDDEVKDSSHREGLNEMYTSSIQTTHTQSPKMVRVDSLGLVYKETIEDDSRFWCDP